MGRNRKGLVAMATDPKHEHWRQIWLAAIANMPSPYMVHDTIIPHTKSQIQLLARCLDMPKAQVAKCGYMGTRPRDDERRERLLKFAGPYGRQLAIIALVASGVSPAELDGGSAPSK